MINLSANLSQMFTEYPLAERFARAAQAGFSAVEIMFPYEVTAEEVRGWLDDHGLKLTLFNMPAGDWAAGERGLAALPGREGEFRAGARRALEYARVMACPNLHLMAGRPLEDEYAAARATLIDNIRYAAELVAADGYTILLEPINTRVDIPGYFYDRTEAVASVVDEVAMPNVKLQYDIYHMQIMEGDLARTIERHLPTIGYIQLGDNPGRGEPGTGEINYTWLLDRINALGYTGYIGCDYRPVAGTLAGLGWAQPYLQRNSREAAQ